MQTRYHHVIGMSRDVQVTQLYTNKAHMIAMGTQLQEQMAMVRVAGTLSKSNEVMKLVNDMMRVGFSPALECEVQGVKLVTVMMRAGMPTCP